MTYMSPRQLNLIRRSADIHLPRYSCHDSDFSHMVWLSMKVQVFWRQVPRQLEGLLSIKGLHAPGACLLGANIQDLSLLELEIIDLALVLIKKCIATHWRTQTSLFHLINGPTM